MYEKIEKTGAWIALILLIGSLLPVAYLGRYNHPTGDDYYYGVETHHAWENTGSIAAVVKEALQGVGENYNEWQGTYSALFLMYLAPNVFSEQAYGLVTGVLLLLLVGSIFYLLKPLVCKKVQGTAYAWVLISSVVSLLCVQTVPFQGESFFWYNGSMYYTGYLAVTFFLFGIVLRYLTMAKRYQAALLWLLAVFLGGGNYVSLLPCLLLLVTLTGALVYKKSPRAWVIGSTTLLLAMGLLVSAAAPGNHARQSGMWKIPAWKAVLKSLEQGIRYMDVWMGKWWLLSALILTPVFWKLCKKRKEWSFRYPIAALVYLYGIFCSMSCPVFYTMNSTGPARAVAIVYYSFILFSLAGYFYVVGYICRRTEGADARQPAGNVPLSAVASPVSRINILKSGWCMGLVLGMLLLAMQAAGGKLEECTAVKAVKLLVSGEARAYDLEYRERLRLLTDDSLNEVVLPPYVNRPEMLYVGDLSSDPQEETCRKVALYFGKSAVSVAAQ